MAFTRLRIKRIIVSRVLRASQWIRILLYGALSTGKSEGNPRKMQPVIICGNGMVRFEKGVTLGYFPSPFFLSGYIHLEARGKESFICIGENTQVNNNFVAIAEHTSISIGKRCLIGTNVEILDSDFHGIRVADRNTSNRKKARPVVIGDDVFIGSNVKIMKGVVIGNGSVIANGSVVVSAVPSGVIAGGNPAKALRAIEE
jgi:acetyltransferase-like isoleucine patch superfamily enzyme